MNSPSPDLRAPEGSSCAEHPERSAQFRCPRCANTVCIVCWQPSFARCQRCLLQAPAEAAQPIAWEREPSSGFARYFGTLASVVHPITSAPAFASGPVRPAARFALYTALPLAMIAGIMPHTQLLLFESLTVRVLGTPSGFELGVDVLRAMLIETVLSAIRFGCLFFPFVSLVRAYAEPQRHEAAMRMMFYRAWVVPAFMLLYYYGVHWPLPVGPEPPAVLPPLSVVSGSVTLLLLMLTMMAMSATARVACGLGPLLSMVVVVVPITLLLLVQDLLYIGVVRLTPPPPLQ